MEKENIVGIAAVLILNDFVGLKFCKSDEPICEVLYYILAVDGKTGTSLSFWIDTASERVQYVIDDSRRKFALHARKEGAA